MVVRLRGVLADAFLLWICIRHPATLDFLTDFVVRRGMYDGSPQVLLSSRSALMH